MPTFPCPCRELMFENCPLCHGAGITEDLQITEHFKFSELVTTSWKSVPNVPTPADIERLRRLCVELLEPARRDLGRLDVNSAFRSKQLDQLVAPGFVGLSGHSIGAAADIKSPTQSLTTIMNWFYDRKTLHKYDQLILEGGCVHIAVLGPYPLDNTTTQRGHSLVRTMPPGASTFKYEPYDPKSPSQLARVR